ncbi:hypothetical protein HHI36_000470 [Cryptolaemus montrouzieri]|uniref:Uncharacterized protein n=1 Tax=Cryptolaemus montrouzieri TaxID=559131 RepID=A0ABD2P4V7_9CUCU
MQAKEPQDMEKRNLRLKEEIGRLQKKLKEGKEQLENEHGVLEEKHKRLQGRYDEIQCRRKDEEVQRISDKTDERFLQLETELTIIKDIILKQNTNNRMAEEKKDDEKLERKTFAGVLKDGQHSLIINPKNKK